MNEPLVSVVIPLFNKEKYISTTLKSVIFQTYQNIEVVVIDDSSTDESLNLARKILNTQKERFVDIKLVTRPNSGQAATRNEGINLANGQFVAFLDADDVWHPEKIAKQVQFLLSHKDINLIFCNYFIFSDASSKVKAVRLSPINRKIKSWLLSTGYGGLLESTGLARKESLLKLGGFDKKLQMCGGQDLAYRFEISDKVGLVDEYLCGYRSIEGAWHDNKSDLVASYSLLMEKYDLPCSFKAKVRVFLKIHLLLWEIRNDIRGRNFWYLFVGAIKNPFIFTQYIFATVMRVSYATLRGILLSEESAQMRKILSL